jgi:hypothetical protein
MASIAGTAPGRISPSSSRGSARQARAHVELDLALGVGELELARRLVEERRLELELVALGAVDLELLLLRVAARLDDARLVLPALDELLLLRELPLAVVVLAGERDQVGLVLLRQVLPRAGRDAVDDDLGLGELVDLAELLLELLLRADVKPRLDLALVQVGALVARGGHERRVRGEVARVEVLGAGAPGERLLALQELQELDLLLQVLHVAGEVHRAAERAVARALQALQPLELLLVFADARADAALADRRDAPAEEAQRRAEAAGDADALAHLVDEVGDRLQVGRERRAPPVLERHVDGVDRELELLRLLRLLGGGAGRLVAVFDDVLAGRRRSAARPCRARPARARPCCRRRYSARAPWRRR